MSDIQLELRRIYRIVRNALQDLRYGMPLGYTYLTQRKRTNSDYAALAHVFHQRITPEDVLVDVGCGAGRVINFWLAAGLQNRIIGLEHDPSLAARTRWRLRHYPNVTIVTGDALEHLPREGTVFYLYNPFGAETLATFKKTLLARVPDLRCVTILYYNCKYVALFVDDPLWSVEVGRFPSNDFNQFDDLAVIKPRFDRLRTRSLL